MLTKSEWKWIGSATVVACSFATRTGYGEEILRQFTWDEQQRRDSIVAGEVVVGDDFTQLRVAIPADQPRKITVLTIDEPGVTSDRYRIEGPVRYENVEGDGYLEMMNHFPGGQAFFSRTLGTTGSSQPLTGSSDWRDFTLPFLISVGSGRRPTNLVFNVYLPGRGTVFLGPLTLAQFDADEDPSSPFGQWWSGSQAGLVGGIAGSVLGCLGGLLAYLVSRGRARGFVFTLLKTEFTLGVLCVAIGLLAVIKRQPYDVYFPLLLIGLLLVVMVPSLRSTFRRRYDDHERRRMDAIDASA